MTREEQIRLMAASIFGAALISQRRDFERGLESYAVEEATNIYDAVQPEETLPITQHGDHHPKGCGCKDTVEKE